MVGGTGGIWAFGISAEYVVPILVIALFWYLAYRRNKQRKARELATRQAAEQSGWAWHQSDPSLVGRWTVEPFGTGRRPATRNVITGEHNGWSFTAFDYRYTTGSGKSSTRHEKAVYVLTLPGTLPKFQAEPEGVFGGRVARAFGAGDLQLDDEEFDRTWKIEAEDKEYARALLHDRMRELLRGTGPWIWGLEKDVMVSTYDGTIHPDQIRARLDLMATVVGQIPDEVWRTYGAGRP